MEICGSSFYMGWTFLRMDQGFLLKSLGRMLGLVPFLVYDITQKLTVGEDSYQRDLHRALLTTAIWGQSHNTILG